MEKTIQFTTLGRDYGVKTISVGDLIDINRLLTLQNPNHPRFMAATLENLFDRDAILVLVKTGDQKRILGLGVFSIRPTLSGDIIGTIDDLVVDPQVAEMDLSDTYGSETDGFATDNCSNVTKSLVFHIVNVHARRMKTDHVDIVLLHGPHEMEIYLREMGFKDTDPVRRLSFRTRNLFAEPLPIRSEDPHGPRVKYGPHGGPHDHPWIKYLD